MNSQIDFSYNEDSNLNVYVVIQQGISKQYF